MKYATGFAGAYYTQVLVTLCSFFRLIILIEIFIVLNNVAT